MAYRILSLDGGGPWALLQGLALDKLYPGMDGHQILSQFDLAIANSGGSITLAGLIKGLRPLEIAGLFQQEKWRSRIFVPRGLFEFPGDLLAKWSADEKLKGLRAVIDDGLKDPLSRRGLSDVGRFLKEKTGKATQLMIAAYDIDRNRGRFFRSMDSALATESPAFEPALADAVHASTHAPVKYFVGYAEVRDNNKPQDKRRFWDGALAGVNNPVLAGVIEAKANGVDDIVALSIGTAGLWAPIAPAAAAVDPELVASPASVWFGAGLEKVAGTILADPPDNAARDADVLTGSSGEPKVVRLNPMIRPIRTDDVDGGRWRLPAGYAAIRPGDALSAYVELRDMEMDAVDQKQVDLIAALGAAWMADEIPNQVLRWNPTDGTVVRGHDLFGRALARAKQLF